MGIWSRVNAQWGRSIYVKLLTSNITILLFSLGLLGYFSAQAGLFGVRQQVMHHNRHLATLTARAVNAHFDTIVDTVRLFSYQLDSAGDMLLLQARAMMELRLGSPLTYRAFYLLDEAGKPLIQMRDPLETLLAAESIEEVALGADPGLTPDVLRAFERARLEGFYASPVSFTGSDVVPVVYLGMGIPTAGADDRGANVMVVEVDLRGIWRTVDEIRIGERGEAFVISAEGVIIAHQDRAVIGRLVPPALRGAAAGLEGQARYEDAYSGTEKLAAYSPVGRLSGWAVVVAQDAAEAYSSLRAIVRATLIVLIAAFGAASGVSLWVARGLSRPIQALDTAVQGIIRTGDLQCRVRVDTRDEIGRLATAFNRMIAVLRQKEDALQRSEERFRTIVETTPSLLVIRDAEGKNIYASPNCEAFIGYSEEQLVGGSLFWADEPDRAGLLASFRESLRSGRGGSRARYGAIRKTGEPWYASSSWEPLREISGGFTRLLIQTVDVTELVSLENRLLQSQKQEALGRLAGGVAHDFNNMMQVVGGYTNLLLEASTNDERSIRCLEQIKEASERAVSLTRQLLAFSRNQVLQPRLVDINRRIVRTEKMLARLIREDIRVELALASGLGAVRVDPAQLDQVLINLALNARDAMPGGGRLAFETVEVEVADSDRLAMAPGRLEPGRYVLLSVADTGLGMDPETQSHIFEPFFSTKEAGRGTGLGLSTVQGIIKQSGGDISVYSEQGRGTTFKIYLPIGGVAAAEAAADGGHGNVSPGGCETILVVEDNGMVRDLIRQYLTDNGYEVVEADNGAAALALFERHARTIDLVLTDVVMPEMSGPEMVQRMKETRPDVKVVFMSGFPGTTVQSYGLSEGAVHFLSKPFTSALLLEAVRETLSLEHGRPDGGIPGTMGEEGDA